jgi:hypothetical protein
MSKIQERIKLHLDFVQAEMNKCDWKLERLSEADFTFLVKHMDHVSYFFAHTNDEDRDYYQYVGEAIYDHLNPVED